MNLDHDSPHSSDSANLQRDSYSMPPSPPLISVSLQELNWDVRSTTPSQPFRDQYLNSSPSNAAGHSSSTSDGRLVSGSFLDHNWYPASSTAPAVQPRISDIRSSPSSSSDQYPILRPLSSIIAHSPVENLQPQSSGVSGRKSTTSEISIQNYTPGVCQNCSWYHCMAADRRSLKTMEKGLKYYQLRRFDFLWSCVCKAASEEDDRRKLLDMWQSLVDSDDIWRLWDIRDEEATWPYDLLQEMVFHCFEYGLDDDCYSGVATIISRRLEGHTSGLCGFSADSSATESTNHPLVMRLILILWKTILACRRTKYESRSTFSLVEDGIPGLVARWWDMIPAAVKSDLLEITADITRPWTELCTTLKRRGHSCSEGHPRESMWRVWVTVQDLRVPYLPDHPNCSECESNRISLTGRPDFVKPHLVALWCISKAMEYLPRMLNGVRPNTTLDFWSSRSSQNILYPEYLDLIDEWLHKLPSDNGGKEKDSSTVVSHARWVPSWLYTCLVENENDLATHWSEIANPIAQISNSRNPLVTHLEAPPDPATWICAVALFSVARHLSLSSSDFRSVAAKNFPSIISLEPLRILLEKAPKIVQTPAVKCFEERLKRSGHTCWQDWEKCGENSIQVLYASAYSTLMNESPPMVGCGQPHICKICRIKDDFHTFSLDVDRKGMDEKDWMANRLATLQKVLTGQDDLSSHGSDSESASETECDAGDPIHQKLTNEMISIPAADASPRLERPHLPVSTVVATGEDHIPRAPESRMEGLLTSPDGPSPPEDHDALTLEVSHSPLSPTMVPQQASSSNNTSSDHFITETGLSRNSKTSKHAQKLRPSELRKTVKDKLVSLLESHGFDVSVQSSHGKKTYKLPWSNLVDELRHTGREFVNWPEVKAEDGLYRPLVLAAPNGIGKAPLNELGPLYEALTSKERLLGIRKIVDSSGLSQMRMVTVIPSSGHGTKRNRDEQTGDVERDSAPKRGRTVGLESSSSTR
ncbi:hypothetical protein D9758_015843 [Tetrapyrgos nigripes]|uniref:Uncharacterized protein n=1 Tax=Tetrapyrgos nigripes TaxID=182062 RepID=A0A8H5FHC5_9AGAR|nr:hypothetical protein D9758_015843 [Tetrapyrgos nigripes]